MSISPERKERIEVNENSLGPQKTPFEVPELFVYGSIGQLTQVNCPVHGTKNEQNPTDHFDNTDKNCAGGAKKT